MTASLLSSGTRTDSESVPEPTFNPFTHVVIDESERPPNEILVVLAEVERELEGQNGPLVAVALTDLADTLSHAAAALRGLCPTEEPWLAAVSRIHSVVRRLDDAASRAEGLAASVVTAMDGGALDAIRDLVDTCGTLAEAAEDAALDAYGCDFGGGS